MAVRRPNTAAQESEAFRLERAVNLFTAQFEHERKHGLLLSEQIRQCEEQLRHHKSNPRLLASTPEERRLRLQFSGLERQIALLNTQIAEIQTGNRELKEMIDGERLNRRTKKGAVETMREDLKTVTVRKGDRSLERIKWKEEDQTQRFEMTQLRCKSAQHTLRQRAKIQELEVTPTQVHVKEDVMLRDQLFRTIKETFRLQSMRAMETLDPSPVQSALLQKWSPKLSLAKHRLDAYLRRIASVSRGLEEIRKIGGFGDVAEAVTAVRKTEEQRVVLESHMGLLGREIDELEEDVTGVKKTIEHRRAVSIQDKTHIADLLEGLRSQSQHLSEEMQVKRRKCAAVQAVLNSTFASIRELREVLEKEEVRERWLQQGDGAINEETVLGCLARVDASLTVLHSWQSSLRGFPLPHLSSLSTKHFLSPPLLKGLTVAIDPLEPDTSVSAPKTEREMRAQVLLDRRFLRMDSRPMTRR